VKTHKHIVSEVLEWNILSGVGLLGSFNHERFFIFLTYYLNPVKKIFWEYARVGCVKIKKKEIVSDRMIHQLFKTQ
jgi:hypothetical protein